MRTVYGGRQSVVKVEPFVGCGRFAKKGIVLEGLLRICGEAI